MPRVAAISASDVITLMLFDNVSDDELPHQIEINSDDDDESRERLFNFYKP